MGLFDKFKTEKNEKPDEKNSYSLHVKTHIYGDENEEEIKNSIIDEIKGEDNLAEVIIECIVDEDKKAVAAGDEDKMYPIELKMSVKTSLQASDIISCISPYVIDLYITDDEGSVIYAEEDLI